ncbi:MAG: transposase, partial [Desulfovibrio sp.]|nr:transposase [Desulfovibrio sp.]
MHMEAGPPSGRTATPAKLVSSCKIRIFHIIADNHSIHKRHEVWLKSHPNVFFHYPPTYASWLNMVEIW